MHQPAECVRPTIALACVTAALLAGACGCTTTNGGSGTPTPGQAESILKGPYYYSYEYEGKTYLIGRPASAVDFENEHQLAQSETLEGVGPKGETVVIEIDSEDASLKEFLWQRYKDANLFYTEEVKDGQIFVLGSEKSRDAFQQSGTLPNPRTLAGAGPGGEDVHIEVDPENDALVNRLEAEFQATHAP